MRDMLLGTLAHIALTVAIVLPVFGLVWLGVPWEPATVSVLLAAAVAGYAWIKATSKPL